MLVTSLAALLPFFGLIRDAVVREGWCAALLSDVYERGTLFVVVNGGHGSSTSSPSSQISVAMDSISVMNVQIHVVNAVLVLIFAHQYLASQRRYASVVRDTACMVAVLLFAVHPSRLDVIGQVNETSVLHQLSICMSLVGVVLSMAFVSAAGTRRVFVVAVLQAACSGAFLSAGAFLGGPVSAVAIPLLFYAAVVLQQIRCHLTLFDAAVLTAMHGGWTAVVAVLRADCAASAATPAPLAALCRSATAGIMAAAFRGRMDALLQVVDGAWREPERGVTAMEEYLSVSLLGFQGRLEAIAASSADGSSGLSATLNALVLLVTPALATALFAVVVVRSVRDAVRWKPMTNFNFCCLASAASAVGGGLQSYVPSAFLSVCLGECMPFFFVPSFCVAHSISPTYNVAVALADAWAEQPSTLPGTGARPKNGKIASVLWLIGLAAAAFALQSHVKTSMPQLTTTLRVSTPPPRHGGQRRQQTSQSVLDEMALVSATTSTVDKPNVAVGTAVDLAASPPETATTTATEATELPVIIPLPARISRITH